MRLGTIAFLLGMVLFYSLPELPPRSCALALPIAVLLGLRFPRLRLPVWGLAGFLWPLIWVESPLALPAEFEGVDLQATGWVMSIPEPGRRSTRFEFRTEALKYAGKALPSFPERLQLAWYDNAPALRVGEKWRFTVRLKRPRGLMNPGGFDYERWLFFNHIQARGYVRKVPEPRLLKQEDRYPVGRFRQKVAERFARLLAGDPHTGILIALAVGDRQGIKQDSWDVFVHTGTGHLMAISGLHIGLISGLVFFFIRSVWTWFPSLLLRWPATKAAALAALASAAGYALLAGFSLPTRRALIMIAVVMTALLWQRSVVPSRMLALALLAVLIIEPLAPLSGGFWLSFGAVAVILYTAVGRSELHQTFGGWTRLQLIVTLGLMPATLFLFESLSFSAPLANLIAIPWAGVVVVPLTLAAVLAGLASETLQAGLLQLAALGMDWLWRFLAWLDSFTWASISLPAPPLWALGLAAMGLLLLLGPRGLPGRWLGAVLCLPLFFNPVVRPARGEAWFTLLDVGMGLAAVVRTRNHVLVYDAGPRLGAGFDAGRIALVPFLRRQRVSRIDTLIISHADKGHTGGVRALLERFAAARILTSSIREVPIENAVNCRAGMEWTWDEVRFRILHPPLEKRFSGDDSSCVLKVKTAGGSVLLPGDIEAAAETTLLRRWGSALAAEVLVAPHHGARDLLVPAFLAAVRPRYVLFSTAYRNRFGYPKPEVVSHYQKNGAIVLNTARHGAITFRFTKTGLQPPQTYRQQSRRYWRSP